MDASQETANSGKFAVIGLGLVGLALGWIASASVAAWNKFQYPYNEPIDLGDVFADMVSMPLSDVVNVARTELFPGTVLMLASFVLAAASLWTGPVNRKLLMIAVGITVPFGLLGLTTFAGPLDGEWVAEGWLMFQGFSIWSALLCATAFFFLFRSSHQAPSVPGGEQLMPTSA